MISTEMESRRGQGKMSKQELLRQAENAERHADQTIDESVKEILRKAAEDYRHEAEAEPD
jgi:hypothetical protein